MTAEQVVVWRQVGRVLKRVEHGRRHEVELRQRLHPQDVFNRAIDVLRGVGCMDCLALAGNLWGRSIRADHINRLTVPIRMIATPSCESSSSTKIADCAHTLLWLMASTMRPRGQIVVGHGS